jgi:hypothetical protein
MDNDIEKCFEDALHREARARIADQELPEPEPFAPDLPAPRLQELVGKRGSLPTARALACWAARLNGNSPIEIAVNLGFTLEEVRDLIDEVHKALHEDLKENLDLNRQLDLSRIDSLISAHMPKAKSGKVKSAALILRALERRSKLTGIEPLPEPTRANQTNVLCWIQGQLPNINKLVDSLPVELPPAAPGS